MKNLNCALPLFTSNEYDCKAFGGRPIYQEILPNFNSGIFSFGQKNDRYCLLDQLDKCGFPKQILVPSMVTNNPGIMLLFRLKEDLGFTVETPNYLNHYSEYICHMHHLTDISNIAFNYIHCLVANKHLKLDFGKVFVGGTGIKCVKASDYHISELFSTYFRNDEVGLYFTTSSCSSLMDFEKHRGCPKMQSGDYVAFLFVKNQ